MFKTAYLVSTCQLGNICSGAKFPSEYKLCNGSPILSYTKETACCIRWLTAVKELFRLLFTDSVQRFHAFPSRCIGAMASLRWKRIQLIFFL